MVAGSNGSKGVCRTRIISLSLILLILLPIMGLAAQDEACGVVTKVVDGDTFDVSIEKADSRIVSGLERVRLADVNSPEIETAQGPSAKDFTFAVLMNKRVYLDIDDLSANGRDTYGRLVCVVYLTGFYGQPLASPNFNRMLVDSGHASLDNFTNNEFNPKDWWSEQDSGSVSLPLESLLQDPLRQIQQSAGNELDQGARGAWDWIMDQISTHMASPQKT